MTKVSTKKEYKFSGIDWLGDIPAGWETFRVKNLFQLSKEKNRGENLPVLSLAQSGIRIRDISTNEGQLAESYENYTRIRPNDLVFNPMDLRSGAVDLSNYDGVISLAYTVIRNKKQKDIFLRYYKYYFQWHYLDQIFFPFGQGVSADHRWTLQDNTLKNFPIVLPPLESQKRIADFLDKKTKVIDDLVAKREELIELLREKRVALITRAVTKGLNPNAKLKPSGVDWLGDIPEGWEIWKLKYLAERPIKNGVGEPAEYTEEMWPRYIRITDIESSRSLRPDTFRSLPNDVATDAPVYYGDLLMAAVGGTFGRAYLHLEDVGEYCYAGYLVRFSPNKKVHPSFAGYWTESAIYWNQLHANVIQATIQNFSAAKYKELLFLLPPIETQKQIADFLDTETVKIDKAISFIESQIEKLKEYRSSLIYHAVTGKIKV